MNEYFFRSCWLLLKAKHPRLRKKMDEIEITLAGVKQVKVNEPERDKPKKRITV